MQTITATFLILHGLVHGVLALSPNPGSNKAVFATFFSRSWLFSSLGLSESAGRIIALLSAAVAAIGFIAAGLSLFEILVPFEWWRTLAIGSAVVSLLLLVIFWHRYLMVGVLIDIVILAALILFNWTPVEEA